jgi:hypothetical protein
MLVTTDSLKLLDAKGNVLEPTALSVSTQGGPGGFTSQYTLNYKLEKGQPDPAKLTLSGSRIIPVEIPFHLKNVPLP